MEGCVDLFGVIRSQTCITFLSNDTCVAWYILVSQVYWMYSKWLLYSVTHCDYFQLLDIVGPWVAVVIQSTKALEVMLCGYSLVPYIDTTTQR